MAWDALTGADLGADVILTTTTMTALSGNLSIAGQDLADATTTYNSGSGTYTKPTSGYDDNDTVLVRVWGGGGGGSTAATHFGGGGGGFNQRAFRYADFPATASYSVGAGGNTYGVSGGASYVEGTGVDVAASGGTSGAGAGTGGSAGFRYSSGGTLVPFAMSAYDGGVGNNANGNAVWGGGGGHYGATADGSRSVHGGAGAYYDGAVGYDAQAPGGGGVDGRGPSMVAGAAGRVQFIVIRGWHSTVMSNNV